MKEINRLEKDSLLYYQGGGANIKLSPEKQNLRKFYNVGNSYIVINALLMPGISNEKARLKEEGKRVSLSMFEHMDELVEIYCRLYSAMCKYTYLYEHEAKYYTYRDDRMSTLEFLRHGQMYSFMSTKRCNDGNKDFHDKDGILLLEVAAQGNIEHIDVNAVLEGESKYPHEQEILFAPFVLLDKELLGMTEEEKCYKDIHKNPPKAKYLLHLRLSSIVPYRTNNDEGLYAEIMDSVSTDNVGQIWETFMSGKEPEADAVRYYVEWKEKFQMYLRIRFAEIKYEVMGYGLKVDEVYRGSNQQDIGERQDKSNKQGLTHKQEVSIVQDSSDIQINQELVNKLVADVENYYGYTNAKRIKYKKCVQGVNVIVSVLYPMMTFFVALSFLENLQVIMKVVSLLASAIGAVVPLIAKGLAWNENLRQRTVTYLKLDELMRDMRYEKSLDENSLNRYVERYKEIISEDNKMGLGNAVIIGKHSENIMKKSEKKQEINNGEKE